MISKKELANRISNSTMQNGISQIPDDLLDQISGGPGDPPEDFHEVFHDANPDPGGPTFTDVFTDYFPYDDTFGNTTGGHNGFP